MQRLKSVGAGILLLLGFWCLGRAVETGLNRDPNVLDKRETVTAGVLLGGPATVIGGWLLWDLGRQRQQAQEKRLRETFFRLIQSGQGTITPLQLAMAAEINGAEAKTYLNDRSLEYDATFQVDAEGNLIYCFHLGTLEGHS